jgi:hypothetical protein
MKKLIKEGAGSWTIKKTGITKIPANPDDWIPEIIDTHYDIYKDNVKVGELERDGYFGYVKGQLFGRPLPELSSYRGWKSGPLGNLHAFLKSNTGKKWLSRSNIKEFSVPSNHSQGGCPLNNPDDKEDIIVEDEFNDNETPLYVAYVRDMAGEEPFMIHGKKYQYVYAKYPDGKVDIAVYSFAGDMTYGYAAWNKMMGIKENVNEMITEVLPLDPDDKKKEESEGLWQELEVAMKRHDWYYGMSDGGYYAYLRGQENYQRITQLFNELEPLDHERAMELWKKYASSDSKPPSELKEWLSNKEINE